MTQTPLADLPTMKDGFRERGAQVTRLEAFVDAAFAFALSLLVISANEVPKNIPELVLAMRGIPAFAGCFLQIALFWHAHVRWSRRYGLDDGRSTLLSLLLVFLVLIYVHPLRLLFGTFFAWMTRGWLPWPITGFQSFAELGTMFMVYAVAFGTMSLVLAALYSYALRQRRELGLSLEEAAQTAAEVASWRWSAAVATLSFVLAMMMPVHPAAWFAALPGMIYFLMNFAWVVRKRAAARARLRFGHEATA